MTSFRDITIKVNENNIAILKNKIDIIDKTIEEKHKLNAQEFVEKHLDEVKRKILERCHIGCGHISLKDLFGSNIPEMYLIRYLLKHYEFGDCTLYEDYELCIEWCSDITTTDYHDNIHDLQNLLIRKETHLSNL